MYEIVGSLPFSSVLLLLPLFLPGGRLSLFFLCGFFLLCFIINNDLLLFPDGRGGLVVSRDEYYGILLQPGLLQIPVGLIYFVYCHPVGL